MLDSSHSLSPSYTSAPDGHVALTAAVASAAGSHRQPRARVRHRRRTAALTVAQQAASQSFDGAWSDYEHQWLRYDSGLRRPSFRLGAAAVREYYESVNVVKASEDKTVPGRDRRRPRLAVGPGRPRR